MISVTRSHRYWPVLFNLMPTLTAANPQLELSQEFQQVTRAAMEKWRVPGIAVGVLRNGEISWQLGMGRLHRDDPNAVKTSSVFEAASLGNVFLAYLVWTLANHARLELDRPMAHYLPLPAGSNNMAKQITARHVLTHTSGLANTLDETTPLAPVRIPGTFWQYSGRAFLHLQRVVEHLTQTRLQTLMDEAVFTSLGMTHSHFCDKAAFDKVSATGHDARGEPMKKQQPHNADTVASLHTNIADMARFLLALVGSERRDTLDRTFLQIMLRPQVAIAAEHGLHWANGVGIERAFGSEYFFHVDANPYFSSLIMGSLTERSGIVVLTNGKNGLDLTAELVHRLYGFEHRLFDIYMLNPDN